MSPQEVQVLQNFLDQLCKVQGISKDVQAQQLINEAVSKQPDASYLLVQRALLLEQALANANNQIASLQTDVRNLQASKANTAGSGFLDPAHGGWGNSASSRPLTASAVNTGMPPPIPVNATNNYASMAAPIAAPASGFFGGGAGSMLGTVAATAAGVAAGAFLFQGIGHLLGQQSHTQIADNSAAQLNQGGGDLLPGYFDQGNTATANTPAPIDTTNTVDTAALDTSFTDDDSVYDGDDMDLA